MGVIHSPYDGLTGCVHEIVSDCNTLHLNIHKHTNAHTHTYIHTVMMKIGRLSILPALFLRSPARKTLNLIGWRLITHLVNLFITLYIAAPQKDCYYGCQLDFELKKLRDDPLPGGAMRCDDPYQMCLAACVYIVCSAVRKPTVHILY